MRKLFLGSLLMSGLATLAFGQAPAPKAAPEYQRMDYFVGTWKGKGDMRPNPLGMPTGQWLGTMTCTKFAGGFHVVCNIRATIGGAPSQEIAIFGYDAEEKTYTWYDIDNTGMNGFAHGSLQEKTWTFLFEMKAGGKPVKLKVGLVEQSTTTLLNKAEVSADDGPWSLLIDAKFAKIK